MTASTSPFKIAVAIERRENVLGVLEFEYLFEVIDPATCDSKTIPLGRFKPTDAVLSCGGDALLVYGSNKDTLTRSVRVVNTRSGEEEKLQTVDRRWKETVELYATGYAVAGEVWRVEARSEAAATSCVAESPKCSGLFTDRDPTGSALAVSFTVQEGIGADADSLALLVHQGLIDHGFSLREKASNLNEIYQEQELQQVHADDATAVQTGRTVSASHLILGRLGILDEGTHVLSMKIVSVERATVRSAFSVSLEGCQGLDLQKALAQLLETCVAQRHNSATP